MMIHRHRNFLLQMLIAVSITLFSFVSAAKTSLPASSAVPTIAAASDLKFAIEEIAVHFEKTTGHKLRLIFGSSGNFYSQLLQGAPFHLFMSADEAFVFKLAAANKTIDQGKLYALGRIGLMVPKGSPIKADSQLKGLASALQSGKIKRFAIANPAHAPYGMRAKEALQRAGLWPQVEPLLVLGENVSQAAQFATSGSTQGGIIAYSLALAPQVARLGDFALIPENWHTPLAQRMVLMRDAPEGARAFYEYLSTPAAQNIMMKYGFTMPRS
jgi:molybdate transport system substrate-binding protein